MPKYSIGGIASFVAAFGWRYKQLGLSNIFEGKEVEVHSKYRMMCASHLLLYAKSISLLSIYTPVS